MWEVPFNYLAYKIMERRQWLVGSLAINIESVGARTKKNVNKKGQDGFTYSTIQRLST